MRKIITILFCLVFSVIVYGITYTSHNNSAVGYYQTYQTAPVQSYQYEFKSTSSYKPIVQYNTVKPIENTGFVSNEYTTNRQTFVPRNVRKNLDIGDDDDPNAGTVPIGEPIVPLLLLMFAYLSYKKKQTKI